MSPEVVGTTERLSSPLSELRNHYTAVVVGSGYGGAIAASRLARAGQSVCLLERGRELHPGEYPRTATEALPHVQFDTADGTIGDRQNLYMFHTGKDINVFSGCGLGGTSLVNANVAMRPSDWVLDDEHWPLALRNDRKGLDDGYRYATEMLQPTPYPESFPPLAKIEALQRSAAGSRCYRTPINVTFRSGPNHVGVQQEACTGCGDCTTGCNYRAKNTLLMNYLPDAVQHGAKVFTEIEVQWIEKASDRWAVRYSPLGAGRERFDGPPLTVTADIVMLGAGTIGSNAILLRSRSRGLPTSDRLGTRFTGNGDALGYSYAMGSDVDAIGAGPEAPDPAHPPGPCITAVIDERDGPDASAGIIIEDAVIPGALAPLVPGQLAAQVLTDWVRGRTRESGGPVALARSALTRGRKGALARTQTFLLMGHDDDEGRLVLDGDRVRIEWKGAGTTPFYEGANRRLATAATAAGGTYLHSPLWARALGHDLITVHPLGGCPMGDAAETAVVDERGRVFAGTIGDGVHDGLYVCDGAIVPLPLGINPLLTISALAERIAALVAADHGWTIDRTMGSAPLAASPAAPGKPPRRPGLRFTEEMSGWFSLGDGGTADAGTANLDAHTQAAAAGAASGSRATFVLTLSSDDARGVTAKLDTPMTAVGNVAAPAIHDEPLTVEDGRFQLFVPDDADPDVRHMWYRLPLVARDGSRFHFEGFKVVRPGKVFDAWAATTTLYATVRRDGPKGAVAGRGILRIAPADFAKQMRTMKVTGPASERERLALLARFQKAFAGVLVHEYGSVVQRASRMKRRPPARKHRALRVPPPEVHPYTSIDGVQLRLTRYHGGDRGPVVVSHGLGANPLTFSTDTIDTNAIEYLVANDFDVWVQEWRGSTLLPTCYGSFTADDIAQLDHPAAERAVREATGRNDLHWVTHCVGSVTVMMATLAGTVKPASILCSQVGAHPVGPAIMRFKVHVNAAGMLRTAHLKRLTSDSYDDESLEQKIFDALLHAYPIPKRERCREPVCRRLAFIYGIAVHHPAVNDTTHTNLHELFGPANLEMLQQLASMAGAERLVAADGSDAYLPHLDRLQLPITFLHGAHNLVWVPESTKRTYDALVQRFGPDHYERIVFADHGHQDTFMGKRSVDDAFPAMLKHLDRAGA